MDMPNKPAEPDNDLSIAQLREPLYRALNQDVKETRLLSVELGQPNDAIYCIFEYAALARPSPPSYETISYVWGDPSHRGSLYLHNRLIDVPISTEIVLKRMRHLDHKRVVWIDSVCINQQDVDERNSQVAMIYGMTSNLMWLGDGDEVHIARADTSMEIMLADMKARTDDFRDLKKHIYGAGDALLFSNSPLPVEVEWDSILQYFASPWFNRLWIVQEAALPVRSICHRGNFTRPLEDVLRVASWITHHVSTMPRGASSVRGLRAAEGTFMFADHDYGRHEIRHFQSGRSISTLTIIAALAGYEASDARDHVFGALGLYRKYMRTSKLPAALEPDYCAPIGQVFRNTAKFIIEEDADLEILIDIRCRPCTGSMINWPSWVPQWHLGTDRYADDREVNITGLRVDDGVKLDVLSLRTMNDINVITVKGIELGTITQFTPVFKRHDIEARGAKAFGDLLECAQEIEVSSRPNSSSDVNRLPHTLITGIDGHV